MSELARPAREGMRVRVTLDLPIVARREISMSPPTSPQHPVLLRISTSTSIIAVVVAMVVIAAWWSGRIVFASVTSGYVPMTLSVALSVLLLSGAILMRTRLAVTSWTGWMPMAMAILVMILSFWVLLEFAAHTGFSIDRLLGEGRAPAVGYVLAQPSPISTATILAASLAAVLSFNVKWLNRVRFVISGLSLFIFSVGVLTTLGYAYGSPLLYGGDVRPVSVLSGISYILIGTALLSLQGPDHWPVSAFVGASVKAKLLRTFVPLVVFVVLVSGSLSNTAIASSSNPALTASLIALLTALAVGYLITRLSWRIGGQIDRTNALLLETQKDLKLANEKLHVLGSITRHDVLNRLAVILGRLELLQSETKDKETHKQVSQSLASAQAIEKIIKFTGEYQNIGVGGPAWIDVEDAFREAVRGVDHDKVTTTSDVLGVELLADRMFEKVLANLVDNTLRHGKNVKTVRLLHQKGDAGLVLIYEDDGGGLSPEDKANLFKRGHGKHTGLGMFLSKEIMEFSGMSIRETGETGVGARFEIRVPADKFRIRAR
jgi:signal transduction histidine kinase